MDQQLPPKQLHLPWLKSYGATNTGKKRTHNEDRYFLGKWADQEAVLAVVADGMGGAQAGEIAAEIAIEAFAQLLEKPLPERDRDRYQLLRDSFYSTDRAIREAAGQSFHRLGMGTTLVVALFTPTHYLHLFAGDSRLYQFRKGKPLYATADHSIVRLLQDLGKITPEDVPNHPMRSQLTSCLGGKEGNGEFSVDPQWDEQERPLYPLQSEDVFLLCSDGLHGLVSDERLSSLVEEWGEDVEQLTHQLLDRALDAGGNDNITALTVRLS